MDDRSLRILATISVVSVLVVAVIGVYFLATDHAAGWGLLAVTAFVSVVLGLEWLRERR